MTRRATKTVVKKTPSKRAAKTAVARVAKKSMKSAATRRRKTTPETPSVHATDDMSAHVGYGI